MRTTRASVSSDEVLSLTDGDLSLPVGRPNACSTVLLEPSARGSDVRIRECMAGEAKVSVDRVAVVLQCYSGFRNCGNIEMAAQRKLGNQW
jgi:hypothetical protein